MYRYLPLKITSFVENPTYCIAYNCLCAQETPFGLPKFARMSKLSNDTAKDSERYKTLGFKSQFDGKPAGMPWAELIEELKTNVLRQPLSEQRRRPRHRSSDECNFPNLAILNLNFVLRLLGRRWRCFWRRAQPGVSCRRYLAGSNGRRSDCNHREDRERIGSRCRLVLGGRTRAEGRTAVPEGHQAKLKSSRPVRSRSGKSCLEASAVETMVAIRAPGGYGGGGDHGGRSWRLSSDRPYIGIG